MATTRFADHLLTGIHASRPAANAVPVGTLYSCTTHGLIYQSDGSTWSTYATLGGTETLPVTIIDAKGDLIAGSAADTAGALTVGSNGQILTADSTQTLGVKWAAAGSAGAMTLLSTTTLGSAGTFDVTSISGSYNDLVIILIGRGADAGATDVTHLTLNADSGANYYEQRIRGNSTTVDAAQNIGANFLQNAVVPAAGAAANLFGFTEWIIAGYASTTWKKLIHTNHAYMSSVASGGFFAVRSTAFWNSTAAVTRVTIVNNTTANFVTGSQLRIYGRL